MNRINHLPQRGASLIEVLASALVLSLGVFAVVQVQGHLRLGAEAARERGQALQLAQQHMERLRAFAALDEAGANTGSYAGIAELDGREQPAAAYGNARYTLSRGVATSTVPAHKSTVVSVAWNDRRGTPRTLTLDSLVAGQSPSLVAALALQRERTTDRGAFGRASTIPPSAKDLGDGRSVWKPDERGTIAYVFDHASGRIVARCSHVAATTRTAQIQVADVAACTRDDAWLLSGIVRLSSSAPPDALRAVELPPTLAVAIDISGPSPRPVPECVSEAQQAVAVATSAGTQRLAVALDATPASLGVASWTDLGDRFVAYHCRIPQQAGGWSGRSRIVPSGWTIGTRAEERRVCRYVADTDGSGRIDANAEHPDAYRAVDVSLTQQNFLLVRGDQSCPSAAVTTAAHQP